MIIDGRKVLIHCFNSLLEKNQLVIRKPKEIFVRIFVSVRKLDSVVEFSLRKLEVEKTKRTKRGKNQTTTRTLFAHHPSVNSQLNTGTKF